MTINLTAFFRDIEKVGKVKVSVTHTTLTIEVVETTENLEGKTIWVYSLQ